MASPPRNRLTRDHASQTYIRAGELEVFRQLQRDAVALDGTMADDRAFAVGPFSRLRADGVVDELGKTRGAITNVWGSQEAFRAAVMNVFLNDVSLGIDDVHYPDPVEAATLDGWIDAWAAVEIERGPRHGMDPESRYGLRWAAWLGLVPYGIWSTAVATSSIEEFRLGAERYATDVLGPALGHFGLTLVEPTTLSDLAAAVSSTIEGTWLSSCLSAADPIGREQPIATTLATSLRLLVRGATR
jgi:hypothetical protein